MSDFRSCDWFQQLKLGFLKLLTGNEKALVPISAGPKLPMQARHQLNPSLRVQVTALDPEERLAEFCRRGWTVWDCGRNPGKSTVLFSRCVGSDGLVVSFSPSSDDFKMTHEQASLGECNNIMYLYVSIAGRSAERQFLDSLLAQRKLTLKQAAADDDIPKPNLIRVSVTGDNSRALAEVTAMVGAYRPHLVLEVDGPEPRPELITFAKQTNYVLRSLESGRRVETAEEMKGSLLAVPEEKITF